MGWALAVGAERDGLTGGRRGGFVVVVPRLGVGCAGIQRRVKARIPKHSKWPSFASLDFLTIPDKLSGPPAKSGPFFATQNQQNYTVPFLAPRSFKIAMSG